MDKVFVTEVDLIACGLLAAKGTAGAAVKRGELPTPTRVGQRYVWEWARVLEFTRAREGQTAFSNGKTLAGSGRKIIRRTP